MATPTLPGTEEQISGRSIAILIGVLVTLHIVAFAFWIWQLAKQVKKDKKVATD